MQNVGAFKVGDFIVINDGYKKEKMRAQIVRFRDDTANHRTGTTALGADLLQEDGKIKFHFIDWIIKSNPDKVAETFAGAVKPPLLGLKPAEGQRASGPNGIPIVYRDGRWFYA